MISEALAYKSLDAKVYRELQYAFCTIGFQTHTKFF